MMAPPRAPYTLLRGYTSVLFAVLAACPWGSFGQGACDLASPFRLLLRVCSCSDSGRVVAGPDRIVEVLTVRLVLWALIPV